MNKQEEKKSHKPLLLLLVNLVAMTIVVALAIFFTFRWIDNYTEHGIAVEVPDITGLQEEDAIAELAQHHLLGITESHMYIKNTPAGSIVSQRPEANAKVKRGRKIYLTISSGKHPMIAIPDIIENCSLREAASRLRAAGFKLTPNDTISGDLDWVYGVRYNGRELQSEELVPEGSELTLIVGGGYNEEATTLGAPTVEEGWFD